MNLHQTVAEQVIELDDLELLKKKNEALRRAVPVTRLVDYGASIGDALTIHARTGGDPPEEWHLVCEELARLHAKAAQDAFARVATLTCGEEWHHAATMYQAAQLAFNADTQEKLRLYELAQKAFLAYALLTDTEQETKVQELRIDSEHGELYGWQIAPRGARPTGAVIVIGGLSGWGAVYLAIGRSLARRGLICLLAEGPGQGSTRLQSGIHMSAETFPLFRKFIDRVQNSGVQRIGVWGNSFGGLFAARLAASDSRVSAVCINGGPMEPAVPQFRTAREQLCSLFGLSNEDDLEASLAPLRLDASRDRIEGSMLVVEGGQDPLVPLGAQNNFLALAPNRSSVFSWADGEHTIYNHWEQRNARVSDWFCETFSASTSERTLT